MTASLPSRRSWGLCFADLFTPKLIVTLREGYTLANLRADVLAGLTVAIVAAPLSMAITIASGASPTQGLYTAIIGGCIVSALGGSRFQIGGPAGAFIVLVTTTVQTHGIDGHDPGNNPRGDNPDDHRISPARLLHQVHSLLPSASRLGSR